MLVTFWVPAEFQQGWTVWITRRAVDVDFYRRSVQLTGRMLAISRQP